MRVQEAVREEEAALARETGRGRAVRSGLACQAVGEAAPGRVQAQADTVQQEGALQEAPGALEEAVQEGRAEGREAAVSARAVAPEVRARALAAVPAQARVLAEARAVQVGVTVDLAQAEEWGAEAAPASGELAAGPRKLQGNG